MPKAIRTSGSVIVRITAERGTIDAERVRMLSEFRELFFRHATLVSGVLYPSVANGFANAFRG